MDDPHAHEVDALRARQVYVDLMITLSEDHIGGLEAVDLLRPLWGSSQSAMTGAAAPETDVDAMLTAWATIAGALADMVSAERRDNGRADFSLADVWGELQFAMFPDDYADPVEQDGGFGA